MLEPTGILREWSAVCVLIYKFLLLCEVIHFSHGHLIRNFIRHRVIILAWCIFVLFSFFALTLFLLNVGGLRIKQFAKGSAAGYVMPIG